MQELRSILNAIGRMRPGQSAILVTLVKLTGSAYRQPGARLLILPDGTCIGTITGGCLEAEICRRAAEMRTFPCVATYSTEDAGEEIVGFGMGCKGRLHLLFERIDAQPPRLEALRCRLESSQTQSLATIFETSGPSAPPVGASLIASADDVQTIGNWSDESREAVLEHCRLALRSGRSSTKSIKLPGATFEAFFEIFRPPVHLLIFGATDSARPLARLAKDLGWTVTICDRRPAYANRAKLPEADEVICAPSRDLRERLRLDSNCAAVITTHNYPEDLALLGMMLDSPAFYVGLLGARARTQQLLADLRREQTIREDQLQRLRSPIGLDIGADTSAEIALSIASEIFAVLRGRAGGPLRDRLKPIHD